MTEGTGDGIQPEMTAGSGGDESITRAPDKDERLWAMLCHLTAFAGYFFPFGNIIGPLVVWLIKKDEFPLVESQGKESLNFQISMTIYFAVSFILIYVVIGIPIIIGLFIADVVLVIMAAIKANDGQAYRYPLTIRFIK